MFIPISLLVNHYRTRIISFSNSLFSLECIHPCLKWKFKKNFISNSLLTQAPTFSCWFLPWNSNTIISKSHSKVESVCMYVYMCMHECVFLCVCVCVCSDGSMHRWLGSCPVRFWHSTLSRGCSYWSCVLISSG